MTTIGIAGGLSVDHLVTEGTGTRFRHLGGPGLFAALGALVVEGTKVRLQTDLPDDDSRFESLLRTMGIDLQFCGRTPHVDRLWILNSSEGRRIVPTSSPDGLEVGSAQNQNTASTTTPSALFCSGLDGLLLSSPHLNTRVPDGVPTVGIDPDQTSAKQHGIDYWMSLARQATVLLPSRVQLSILDQDAHTAARLLASQTNLPVIARLDADGILVIKEDCAWMVQDPAVLVVDTIGAGDASAAAIVASLSKDAHLVEAAEFGASAARLALSDWGHDGLLSAPPLSHPFENLITKEL